MAEPEASRYADPFKLTIILFSSIAFMYFAGEVLKPLALSILFSFALTPGVRLLEKAGVPRAASVVFMVLLSLGLLGGVGYVVGQQLTALAADLPKYRENIEAKLSGIGVYREPGQESTAEKLERMANEVTARMEAPAATDERGLRPIQRVEVISHPSFQERLSSAVGPYLEFLGVGSFVLILVLFMLIGREELSDRIVALFGHYHVTLTTRTMQEIGQRISKYLGMFSLMNAGFGLVVGLGLWAIGVPYAVLWGSLAALLRFIPYVGPAAAFVMPVVFSFAYFPGWKQALEVVGLFLVAETALNSFLEPIIYGKTTGVSALGLLVAAMFWTWLWGTMGLLLSTPLTVCLAVIGKYVPALSFFSTMLGEEAELEPDVRFYQRLVALDRERAIGVVEEALKRRARAEVFDEVLIPALARAERDAAREELSDTEREFIWSVVGEVLDSLEGRPDYSLSARGIVANGADGEESPSVVGLAVENTSDALALRMLGQLLKAGGCRLDILACTDSSLQVAERVANESPRLVVASVLPKEGLALGRYLVRQLRARFPELPIVLGRWGHAEETGNGPGPSRERLAELGATKVVDTLADARERILGMVKPELKEKAAAAPLPA
ncbi:AI-2E family transporter [Aquisphaera giovannonii]|uniref:AI-2E family transporter n=1 Tax=Aquisphaera giovannonii TaxID=406548 RepID=UPI001FEA34FE|nr:AI-2E family transporter [Aquisphaera giovannonii]